jgi:hypothetical protein
LSIRKRPSTGSARPEGKQSGQSEHQKKFQKKLEAAEGRYVLANSLEEVIAALSSPATRGMAAPFPQAS